MVLRLLGGAEQDAEDVVQETWIRATERLEDFRWEAAFARNLQSEREANGTVPIAVAQQPRVTRPDVRELPWENVTG